LRAARLAAHQILQPEPRGVQERALLREMDARQQEVQAQLQASLTELHAQARPVARRLSVGPAM